MQLRVETKLGPVHTNNLIMLSFTDGTHRSSVRTYCALPVGPARQCPPVETASTQCHPVRRRARLQVAGLTAAIRQVAHHLYADESVGQERGARPGLCPPATRTDHAHPARGRVTGQHHRQGPSRRHGGVKKNDPQAIGKSRGGWTTKLHLAAANERTALTFSLSPGPAHDAPTGRHLLHGLGPAHDSGAGHGPRLRRPGDLPTRSDSRVHARGAATSEPTRPLGVRPAALQTAQRSRAAVPTLEGLSSDLYAL